MEAANIVLSPALQVIFDRLASPALQKLSDIWGVKDNRHRLQLALMRVQAILQDAEEQQLTNKSVRLWLSNLKNVASDAEDLLDSFIAQETKKGYDAEDLLSDVKSAVYRAFTSIGFQITNGTLTNGTPHAERFRETLNMLEMTIHEGLLEFNFREPSIVDRRSTIRETGSRVVDSKIYGRDDDKEKLVKVLLSSETSEDGYATCIPIIGIGGIGKTTLTQLTYNDERVLQHFDSRIWIFVSEEFNVKKIMKAAIERATGVECNLSEIELLQSRLHNCCRRKDI